VLIEYQIADDELIQWKPQLGGLPFTAFWEDAIELTRKEGDLLDDLASARGVFGLNEFKGVASEAFEVSEDRFPVDPTQDPHLAANDNHTDAFRHAYWSARLAQEFGADFATAFTEAHEGSPENVFAEREAMDLYNNSVGIQIAVDNPDASAEGLADLIEDAVDDGDLLVVDSSGNLDYSNQVAVGDTGHPVVPQDLPGRDPAEWDGS